MPCVVVRWGAQLCAFRTSVSDWASHGRTWRKRNVGTNWSFPVPCCCREDQETPVRTHCLFNCSGVLWKSLLRSMYCLGTHSMANAVPCDQSLVQYPIVHVLSSSHSMFMSSLYFVCLLSFCEIEWAVEELFATLPFLPVISHRFRPSAAALAAQQQKQLAAEITRQAEEMAAKAAARVRKKKVSFRGKCLPWPVWWWRR